MAHYPKLIKLTNNVGSSFTGGTVAGLTTFTNGLSANTFSATTLYGNGSNLTGISSGSSFTGGTVSGSTTFTNGLSANTISATTYQNLPVSGLTAGSNINISGNNNNFTISVTGITSGGSFTGGTVTGSTSFTSGLTANTISATTYQNIPSVIQISCSDEITALVTGTTTTFRMPYNMLLTEVRGSLTTAQVSGNTFTVDVLNSGTTILSTLLTINNNQKTSKAVGTTQPIISTPNIIDDSEISVRITQIGNGTARGLKVTLIGNRLN